MPDSVPVYLDYNATAPVRQLVAQAMVSAMGQTGNPSSVHQFGRAAKQLVNDAREQVANLVGVAPHQVIFTGSGTEANNLALQGLPAQRVLVSAVEHPSVLRVWPKAEIIPVDKNGVVRLDELEAMLVAGGGEPVMVAVMLANNEVGAIQPIAEVVALVKKHNGWVHCDAVQAAGKIPVNFAELGVDSLTLSAHKIGGPQGVGALVVREDLPLSPVIRGGGHERNLRAGTHNVAGIVGFGLAAEMAGMQLARTEELAALRDELEAEVMQHGGMILAREAQRLPNTSCIVLKGLKAETQVMRMDLANVAVSAGAACSSGKVTVSHVLQAMGLSDDMAGCSLRVSLGWQNTRQDVERFLRVWRDMAAMHAADCKKNQE